MAWRRKPRTEAKPDDKSSTRAEKGEDRQRIVNGIRISDGVAIIRRGG